ncbi:MAG: hypothetical protein KGL10_01000 [Alphaproteobacteria bacterium]|nr:hypothetical protein [Alphaproteobacteria bacterium]MDE2335868.1 hypothetical protein [Alphaproteobacteria bacterium]
MIKLIGLKRIVVLVFLVALNLMALGVYLFSVGPMLDGVQSQKDALSGAISGLHGRIAGVKADTAYMQENISKYTALQAEGFFLPENRFTVKDAMEKLRVAAGISNFAYSVGNVKDIPNKDAGAVHYKLIDSAIGVDHIVSPLDANIYLLVQDIDRSFPAFVRLQSMQIHRSRPVDAQSLKAIANGQPVSFVDATLAFEWIAMVPDKPASPAAAGGFRGQ